MSQTVEEIYNKGVFHFENRNLDEALLQFQKVLEIIPSHSSSYFFIGFIWGIKADYQKAREYLDKAISLKPDEPDFYHCLGRILDAENKTELAIENFKKAINLSGNPVYYHSLGLAFHSKKMLKEAIENYNEAIKLDNNNHFYLNNLGVALDESNEADKAVKIFTRAISLNPDNPEYYNNLGIALHKIENLEKAEENYVKAIGLNPDNGKYYNNLGIIYEENGNYEKAIKYYEKAIKLSPDYMETYKNISFANLIQGNFKKGWEKYEVFRKDKPVYKEMLNLYRKPEWNGEDIKGKTIYVCWEQGLGDTMHFARYLPFIKELGAKVIFNCQPALINVLKSIKGFDLIVSNPVTREKREFDTFVFLMSLCRIFTRDIESIPANVPYIYSSPEALLKWSEKFKNEKRPKIGFTWHTKFLEPNFYKKSCPVEKFVKLAEIFPESMFYSMQKGPFEAEINKYNLPNLISLSSEINDFADSAAILENMDLIISVDTSISHLAGAMGKKVWNLLSYLPDWRWFLNRDDSPWYPTMRLIRQKSPGDWDSVFKELEIRLSEM